MGMAASQARLLSLTARLTDNEMRSQMISNSKVRLSDKTGEASDEYMNSLNTTQLQYMTYTSDGEKTYQKMNAGLVNEYGPLKNQYGLINTKNNIMVNGVDGDNYARSANIHEFLDKYGLYDKTLKMVENPEWKKQAELVYGNRYDLWMNGSDWETIISEDFQKNNKVTIDLETRPPGGAAGDWINKLNNAPEAVGKEPIAPDKNDPKYNLIDIWATYKKSACFNDVKGNDKESLWHMDHVLSHLFHDKANDVTIVASNGGTVTIKAGGSGAYFSGHAPSSETGVYEPVRNALQQQHPDIYQQAIDLYVELIKNMDSQKPKEPGSTYNGNGQPTLSNQQIYELYNGLNATIQRVSEDGKDLYDKDYAQWQKDHSDWQTRLNNWNKWVAECAILKQTFVNQLDKLNNTPKEIAQSGTEINDKDKAEWYTNLWFRMGGKDEDLDTTKSHKDKDRYEILTENQLNNAEWLQFALENGILSMEQVKFETPNADYPELKTRTWNSIIYSSSSDIREQENNLAITKAEVKYNKALKEIQYKDKEYDQDLKKLDTEHNAIQTEYDSLKTVIQKNTERSFKAFS